MIAAAEEITEIRIVNKDLLGRRFSLPAVSIARAMSVAQDYQDNKIPAVEVEVLVERNSFTVARVKLTLSPATLPSFCIPYVGSRQPCGARLRDRAERHLRTTETLRGFTPQILIHQPELVQGDYVTSAA